MNLGVTLTPNSFPCLPSLQRFKIRVASAVVSVDNSALESMTTCDLLELFQGPPDGAHVSAPDDAVPPEMVSGTSRRAAAVLAHLDELWSSDQYDDLAPQPAVDALG